MLANFHAFGNFPVVRERLKSLAKGEAILLAVALSMKADMPSGPLALLVSRPLIRCNTSSGNTVAPSYVDRPEQGYKSSVRGCSVEFQQLAKNAFSKSAFPLSSETIESLLCKAGIVFI